MAAVPLWQGAPVALSCVSALCSFLLPIWFLLQRFFTRSLVRPCPVLPMGQQIAVSYPFPNYMVVKCTPNQLTRRFQRAIQFSGLPHFRFHDLRHYSASFMHAIGIPDSYIMERGGWQTDNVMKTVYRHTLNDRVKEMNRKVNAEFNTLCNTKCNTK